MPDRTRRRVWPDSYMGAVSLSYDGGDISHVETVASCLDALCLRATFYVPPTRLLDSPQAWKELAAAGHEIGNGSLLDGADAEGLLYGWTPEMVDDDLQGAEELYRELTPNVARRSVAYPLPEDEDSSSFEAARQFAMLRPVIRAIFPIARGYTDGFNVPGKCDMAALRCFRVTDHTYADLVTLTEAAIAAKAWAIFVFRGVGSGEPAIDAVDHAKFGLWLAERRERILTAPVHEVGTLLAGVGSAVVQVEDEVRGEAPLGRIV